MDTSGTPAHLGLLPWPLLASLQQAGRLLQQVGDDIIGYFKEFLVYLLILSAVVVAMRTQEHGGAIALVGTPRDLLGDGAQVSFPESSRDWVSGWGPHSEMVSVSREQE